LCVIFQQVRALNVDIVMRHMELEQFRAPERDANMHDIMPR